MLKILLPAIERFNEETNEFLDDLPEIELLLEHSLASMSKWESKVQKPFLDGKISPADILNYVYEMIVSPEVGPEVLLRFTQKELDQVNDYIGSSQSATTFGELPKTPGKSEKITSELIYYWMVAYNIPFECQYWHLNRLFALIRICNIKNSDPKKNKVSKAEAARLRHEENERRKRLYQTTG